MMVIDDHFVHIVVKEDGVDGSDIWETWLWLTISGRGVESDVSVDAVG